MPTPPFPTPLPEADRLAQRFAQRLEQLRQSLLNLPPETVAQRSGAEWSPGNSANQAPGLRLHMWGRPYDVRLPDYTAYPAAEASNEASATAQPANPLDQAMLLYYLSTADGAPLEDRWVSFADLPDGRFYNQAFQGYTGQELARAFGDDRFAFEQAAQRLGGAAYPLGDAAYRFLPLPKTPILAVYWQGDEDFPAACQLLFDAAAGHYLPTDGYAILGSRLTRMLQKAAV